MWRLQAQEMTLPEALSEAQAWLSMESTGFAVLRKPRTPVGGTMELTAPRALANKRE